MSKPVCSAYPRKSKARTLANPVRPQQVGLHAPTDRVNDHALMKIPRDDHGAAAQERLALDRCTLEQLLREPGCPSFDKAAVARRMDAVSTV